jgi:hypothetical protein
MNAAQNLSLTGDYQAGDLAPRIKRLGLVLAVLGLGTGAALGAFGDIDSRTHFWYSYLVAFCYVLTIGLGAMFFTIVGHVVNTHWNITLRRLAELVMSTVPLVCLFGLGMFIPLLLDHDVHIWRWAHHHDAAPSALSAEMSSEEYRSALGDELDEKEHLHLIEHKGPYLNLPGFAIRLLLYFLTWFLMARFFLKKSVAQDTASGIDNVLGMKRVGAPSILLFALTISFAAFDLIMSLDETWFSTIFGVYIFAGSFLSCNAFLVLMSKWLQARGKMLDVISKEHYHDLGKWMFAFTFFWGYIAFSQFMLIWYANIPEETHFYIWRSNETWIGLSFLLMFGHFLLPFPALLSRHVKRNTNVLKILAGYMLIMHYVDLYWLIMPNYTPPSMPELMRGDNLPEHPFGLVDVFLVMGFVGVFLFALANKSSKQSLLPLNDPLLAKCLGHKNI